MGTVATPVMKGAGPPSAPLFTQRKGVDALQM
jgi:hypothetical protein